jgi:hypothetical protein
MFYRLPGDRIFSTQYEKHDGGYRTVIELHHMDEARRHRFTGETFRDNEAWFRHLSDLRFSFASMEIETKVDPAAIVHRREPASSPESVCGLVLAGASDPHSPRYSYGLGVTCPACGASEAARG